MTWQRSLPRLSRYQSRHYATRHGGVAAIWTVLVHLTSHDTSSIYNIYSTHPRHTIHHSSLAAHNLAYRITQYELKCKTNDKFKQESTPRVSLLSFHTRLSRLTVSSGALGSIGTGADSLPLFFNPNHNHDEDNANPPLAIARVGGQGGSVFVYAEGPFVGASQEGCTSFAGGGRQWF